MTSISSLPHDTISKIGSFLTPKQQLITCCHLNKAWRSSCLTGLIPHYDFVYSLKPFYQQLSKLNIVDLKQQVIMTQLSEAQLKPYLTQDKTTVECSTVFLDASDGRHITVSSTLSPSSKVTTTKAKADTILPEEGELDQQNVMVVGATVPAIIDHLIHRVLKLKRGLSCESSYLIPLEMDSLLNTWIHTYQSQEGLTPQNMLLLLLNQFVMAHDDYVDHNSNNIEDAHSQQLRMIGLIDVIQCWMRQYVNEQFCLYYTYNEEAETMTTISYLLQFIDEYLTMQPEQANNSHTVVLYLKGIQLKNILHHALKNAESRRRKLHFNTVPESDPTSSSFGNDLMNVPLDVLAEQLTVYQYELIRSIRTRELCGIKWRNDKAACPNVMNMLHKFGKLAEWVATRIVVPETPEERAEVIRRFISLCKHLADHRNFQCTFAVVGGIMSASVFRLRRTKALLTEQDMETLEEFRELVSLRGSFQRLRTYLESCLNLPAIPYTGYVMGELKAVSDFRISLVTDTTAKLKNSDIALINTYNLIEEYEIISQFERWQHNCTYYEMAHLTKYESIQRLIDFSLESSEIKSQEALFRLSLAREPRHL